MLQIAHIYIINKHNFRPYCICSTELRFTFYTVFVWLILHFLKIAYNLLTYIYSTYRTYFICLKELRCIVHNTVHCTYTVAQILYMFQYYISLLGLSVKVTIFLSSPESAVTAAAGATVKIPVLPAQ